jgi:hypothetical protein
VASPAPPTQWPLLLCCCSPQTTAKMCRRAVAVAAAMLSGTGVAAYECDPGRTNATARAPCKGWDATADAAHNATHCEVELGCCWQVDPTKKTDIVCWAPVRAPWELPRITNPGLTELGFFGQPYADESGYDPVAQKAFATFGAASDLPTLTAGAALGMTSLFRTQLYLVQHGNWSSSAPARARGHRLFPDWRLRWQRLADQLQPWVANGTVSGFHIGDELVWGGLPYADLDTMASVIAGTPWGGSARRDLIVYSNEAAGPIVRNQNCFHLPANYDRVPPAITWISFDFYNPPGGYVKNEYETFLYPKMSPRQKAILVPDASGSAHRRPGANGSRSGWAVPDMIARAHEYFAWAAADQSGRVIGLNPWHWKTVNYTTGDFWELGVASIPALRHTWADIGARIRANRDTSRHQDSALNSTNQQHFYERAAAAAAAPALPGQRQDPAT